MPGSSQKSKKILKELHSQEAERFAERVAENAGLPYLPSGTVYPSPDALQLLQEEKAKKTEIVPFKITGRRLSLAITNPYNPHLDEVQAYLQKRGYQTSIYIVSSLVFERLIGLYNEISYTTETERGVVSVSGADVYEIIEQVKDLKTLRGYIKKSSGTDRSTSRLFEILLAGSIALKSSDIHVEPQEIGSRIRYRIDGILIDVTSVDATLHSLLSTRIKLTAGLKLNIKAAQDGRFSVRLDKKEIEVRVSAVPENEGESIVLRLLDPESLVADIEKLGFQKRLIDIVKEQIYRPNGIVITTGPTGSGKTTTLYSFIRERATPEIKIITLEDPIEYHIPAITQTQIGKKYTFADGLRAILRQDPDIILVGEIRDREVAETSLNASLSGHLVFSTLHTNNAAGAFTRLLDLGIDPKVMISAFNLVLAQRLVRRVIPENMERRVLGEEEMRAVHTIVEGMPPSLRALAMEGDLKSSLYPKQGMVEGSEAYKGRVGLFEAIVMDESIEKSVMGGGSIRSIQNAARTQELPTLVQDAVIKMAHGITTIDEIKRVIDIHSPDR